MIRLAFKFSLFALMFFGISSGFAQGYEQEKKISKSISTSANSTLSIHNKHGKVHINTHAGKDIKVNISIKARANSNSQAQQILDKIQVEITEGTNIMFNTVASVKANTKYAPRMQSITGNKSSTMIGVSKVAYEVNYFVTMPKHTPLTLKNNFGGVYLADHQAKLDMQVTYGDLKADRLTGTNDKQIAVRFGSATIDYIQKGKLNIAYSPFTLAKAGNITLKNDYSDCNLGSASTLTANNKGGSLKIDKVDILQCNSAHSKIRLGTLNKSLKLSTKSEGNFSVEKIASTFERIQIESNFTSLYLGFEDGSSYRFTLDSKYGQIALDRSKSKLHREIRTDSSKFYEGRFGASSNPTSKVIIEIEYGNITLK